MSETSTRKRTHNDTEIDKEGDEDAAATEEQGDEIVGPSLPGPAELKKRKILPHEHLYLENLPSAESYEKSYMHRDVITHCIVTSTDFIITASNDGHIKFWKKVELSIEFVKHFRSHLGPVVSIATNVEGSLFCSASNDKSIKIFDVLNFDMINMMRLDYVPTLVEWIHGPGDPLPTLAVADADSTKIYIYDGRGTNVPLHRMDKLHTKPVVLLKYNPKFDVTISIDKNGILGKLNY